MPSPERPGPPPPTLERLTPEERAAGDEILVWVRRQVAFGPRCPGSRAHRRLTSGLLRSLRRHAQEVVVQKFAVRMREGEAVCSNLIGLFPGAPGEASGQSPLLLGTHFDTRLQGDRESDPGRRGQPIPGANDGGSGTAILVSLLPLLARERRRRDVTVVFFDAEDVGDIAGNPFALGARRFVERRPVPLPGEAVILDMVGGAGLRLDLDAHILHHPPSMELTRRVFALGRALAEAAFGSGHLIPHDDRTIPRDDRTIPRDKLRYIVSDQYPFMLAGIASCLLIDLDYPQWHTQGDLPEAMSAASLATVAAVLRRFLLPPRS